MTILNTFEHVLDGMGVCYEGNITRVPEYEHHDGEYCFMDDAGTLYRMDEHLFVTIKRKEPSEPQTKPVQPEVRKPRAHKPKKAWDTSFAENLYETGRTGVPTGRALRIEKAFSDSDKPMPDWRRKRMFKSLKTEPEFAFCAISCNGAALLPYAEQALSRVSDKPLLYTVAVSARRHETAAHVIDRFKEDRAFLRAVVLRCGPEPPQFDRTRAYASECLKRLEAAEIAGIADQAELTDLLLNGDLLVSIDEALPHITEEAYWMELLQSGQFDRRSLERILRRVRSCSVPFQKQLARMIADDRLMGCEEAAYSLIGDPDAILSVVQGGKHDWIRRAAEWKLFERCRHAQPLTDAQQETLLPYYRTLDSLSNCKALRLLNSERLGTLLTECKRKGIAEEPILKCMEPSELTDAQLAIALHTSDREQERRVLNAIWGMEPERLKRLVLEQNDYKLQEAALSSLMHQTGRARLDEIVPQLIERARRGDGYDGKQICNLWRMLPPEDAVRYGLIGEHEEGETQDDETWETQKVKFDGHRYWVYYSQTDGGGSSPAYGSEG